MRVELTGRGIDLAYDISGSGDAVVVLHGGSARRQSFDDVIPLFGDGLEVFAVDLRGHGESSNTPGQYRLTEFAADISEFLREVVRRPAVLVGHSLGALVGTFVAAERPDAVTGLVIGDAPLERQTLMERMRANTARVPEWKAMMAQAADRDAVMESLREWETEVSGSDSSVPLRTVLGADHPWFGEMADSLAGHDPDFIDATAVRYEDTYGSWDPYALLPRITAPALLLQGDPDAGGLLPDADVELALRLLPAGELVRLDGVGHGLHWQAPERVAGHVRDFLRKHAR